MAKHSQLAHPGFFVREQVLPPGLSVTNAAKLLGVSRPALSNFLNGKAALSAEMAVRLEKAFGVDRSKLVGMQAAYDELNNRAREKDVAVRAFVPSFLTIKASQIDQWADRLEARALLPVLLRKLVHSAGRDLRRVDFPGYDNSQRKGSDGFVEAGSAAPWVPEGKSYWEFGTDKKQAEKANKDYSARLRSVEAAERANGTFVFVTPRNWSGKTEWEKRKREAGDWKTVRAFDASDLEQWLEQSVPAQIWLAEQLSLPTKGYETLERSWDHWANATEPALRAEIFMPALAAHREAFKSWLDKPADRAFVIVADSKGEALAFLACLFDEEGLRQYKDRAAVFTSPEALRTLIVASAPFIPIVVSDETERELVDARRGLHCIAFRPRGAVQKNADITLDQLGYDAFRTTLQSMGVDENDVDRLSRESGRSPTILRRRLSKNAAIKSPEWASDDHAAKALLPLALMGAWHSEMEADCEVVSKIADQKYEIVEENVARLLRYDDSPVWSAGRYRGVASKIDALFAVAAIVTPADLERFFGAAERVLLEEDPALDLPEADRWAAGLHGKKRKHSDTLRKGICETLVVLSVHGNDLFQERLGIDVENRIKLLIRKLLTPLTLEKLLSHDKDLPRYAEAAPDEFLSIVESDLHSDSPAIPGLLKPVDRDSLWGSPSRTGILWALECLAWKPRNLSRVAIILAQLARTKIDDNWLNKPGASLQAIFRSWMPQTAATVDQRIKALQLLAKQFPDVAWQVAIEQIKPGSRMGTASYRPRWRSDASGAGQVVTRGEYFAFNQQAIELLVGWPRHDEKTFGDLVESLEGMREEDQVRVWDLVDDWIVAASDPAKAVLRERIRRFAFTRRGRNRNLGEAARERARKAYEALEPANPTVRHGWLFAETWVQESADELEARDFDFSKREARIDRLRREAIAEIWTAQGFDGVRSLLSNSNAAGTVGRYTAVCTTTDPLRVSFVLDCLSLSEDLRGKGEWCIQGFLYGLGDAERASVLRTATKQLAPNERVRLFTCAPFQKSTWDALGEYGDVIRTMYWKAVIPSWGQHTPVELNEVIDRLLDVQRPRAAFHVVRMDLKDVETNRLKLLLRTIATVDAEPAEHFKLESYSISQAFDSLDGRDGVTRDEMAQLEFLFIGALELGEHGIPNLTSQIAESPVMFAQAVGLVYKRSDSGDDPPEWRIENPSQKVAVATAAHRVLQGIKSVPGSNADGQIDAAVLGAWIAEVRRLCTEYARLDAGDQCLGQLLAKSPVGENGVWPCASVCQVLEEIASPEIAEGLSIGVYNLRGVHWRGEGGKQERELAAKYRAWAEQLCFEYPYVGNVLENIALSYDRDAGWEDADAKVRKRLQH